MSLLNGKNAIITGSNRGIGYSVLQRFAEEGCNIWACTRVQCDSFEKDIALIADKYNVWIKPIYFDLSSNEEIKKGFKSIFSDKKPIDILVNNAGIMPDALIGMIGYQMMLDVFNTNVFAVVELLQLTARVMSKQKSGSIINLASMVGVHGNKGQLVYSASKGAVIALTKTAAKELAPNNIRVNAIAPGMVDTDLLHAIGKDRVAERLDNVGMGRLATPVDVANACVYLASNLSEYVTGQVLGVDGAAII